AGDHITETQRIYIYNEGDLPLNCPNESSFMVTIVDPEEISLNTKTYCDNFSIPTTPFGSFFSQPNGSGEELVPGTQISNSQNIYFYFQSLEPPFCEINLDFYIEITPSPEITTLENVFDCTFYTLPVLANGKYYDAPGGTGNELLAGTVISETQTIYIYAIEGDCSKESSFTVFIGLDIPESVSHCVRYTLPPLPIGGYYTEPMGQGIQLPAGTMFMT
ncbi:MAG: adhesin, partial [Flavobacterium sp.]